MDCLISGNLIDFIDIDNAYLGFLYIVITFLKQLLNDVLDILTHIARFSERCRIGDSKGNIQQARQGFCQQCFTRAGRPTIKILTLATASFALVFS